MEIIKINKDIFKINDKYYKLLTTGKPVVSGCDKCSLSGICTNFNGFYNTLIKKYNIDTRNIYFKELTPFEVENLKLNMEIAKINDNIIKIDNDIYKIAKNDNIFINCLNCSLRDICATHIDFVQRSICVEVQHKTNISTSKSHFVKIKENMENIETKEIKITPPEGYEIDKENSTFDCIKFKLIQKKRWRDDENNILTGYYITSNAFIKVVSNLDRLYDVKINFNVFATEKQAKSALAMARISQIMANDTRFGGVIADKEWINELPKYCIDRHTNKITKCTLTNTYIFLAFHTEEQRDLFLQENEDLIKDYFMLD